MTEETAYYREQAEKFRTLARGVEVYRPNLARMYAIAATVYDGLCVREEARPA
jgi:hypothetical protein